MTPVTAPRRRGRTLRTCLVAVFAATGLAAVGCIPETPPPSTTPTTSTPPDPGATEPVVTSRVDGFSRPWDLQFAPDGTALVTERGGRLAAVIDGARAVVATVPDVKANGEGGLMGFAVDPGFATNRQVYLCFDSSSGSDVRVVRFRVLLGYTGIADATPIVTGIPANGGVRHQGCRVEFGPAGDLWVTTGDAALPTAPQDRASLAGKVLRMSRDGVPSPTNPAASDPGGGWNPLVHTYGHRNVQGLAFRPSDGAAFSVEHGTDRDDEINLLSSGADYGWNPVGAPGVYDESNPMTAPGATPAVWSSGYPTIAPSGATFLRGEQWGDREGQLAVAVLKGTRLMLVDLDGDAVASVESRITNQGRLRSARMGPDGSLWLVQDAATGSLLKVTPVTG
ncbi:MAG: PQQ-dependent sugar dehydrogenase [Microthrixaceae bacterium]